MEKKERPFFKISRFVKREFYKAYINVISNMHWTAKRIVTKNVLGIVKLDGEEV